MPTATLQSRMTHPVVTIPAALKAMQALDEAARGSGLPQRIIDLVLLRASQINGCSFCVDMHARDAQKAGETDERLFAVAAWREAPYFTKEERAALALAEAVTRLSDREDPVPDGIWEEASRHFNETELAGLLLEIAGINVWNRLNVAVRQVAGAVPHKK